MRSRSATSTMNSSPPPASACAIAPAPIWRSRPRPDREMGAVFNLKAAIHGLGNGTFELGPNVGLDNKPLLIGPSAADAARCQPGKMGTFERLNTCVDWELPMNASVGARYK